MLTQPGQYCFFVHFAAGLPARSRTPRSSSSSAPAPPASAALASPAPVSVAEVQAQLATDEALVLFLDMPERKSAQEKRKPFPEEAFAWVVTKSRMRWVRSDLGAAALAREVAALRCGLDAALWHGDAASRCRDLIKAEPRRFP